MNPDLTLQFKQYTGYDFDRIYSKYRPKLIFFLTRFTKDQINSEDFAEEAFIQALEKITTFNKEKSQIHTWIYKIAENMIKKDFKDKKRMGTVTLDDDQQDSGNGLINTVTDADLNDTYDIEKDNIVMKKAELINEAIQNLPEKYRKVMILRELRNKSYLEIADICSKNQDIELDYGQETILPTPEDFMNIEIENDSENDSYINFTFNNGEAIEFTIPANDSFKIDKYELSDVREIKITACGYLYGNYITSTNLSTVKSQISKGRQLIQEAVRDEFEILDSYGIR